MTKTPRPFMRRDARDLVELIYNLYMRAIDEQKFDVARNASLALVRISQHARDVDRNAKL